MSRPRGWLPARLPMGLRDDDILVRFVAMLEVTAESVQQNVDQLPYLADPSVTPLPMLDWLARMVGSKDLERLPDEQRRAWVRSAGHLVQRRGTKAQIEALVEPFAAGAYSVVDDGGVYREGEAAACAATVWVTIDELQYTTAEDVSRLVREAVPAHCALWMRIGDDEPRLVTR